MALLSAILFAAATPASKVLLEGFTPFQLAGLLYLGAAIAVAPGAVFFHDHLGYRGWIGVIAAFVASVVIAWHPGSAGYFSGILVLLACICWGIDNHLTALIDGITPSQSTLWKGAIAGTVNLSIGVTMAPISVGYQALAIALLVGALSYGASIVLYIRSAQKIGATRAQVLFSSAPFFGVALSVLFVGESLSIMYAIAIPIFLFGVVSLLMESHAHEHSHEAITHEHSHHHDDGHHTHVHPDLPFSVHHTHQHAHGAVHHSHPHWPDIHHRHKHRPHQD